LTKKTEGRKSRDTVPLSFFEFVKKSIAQETLIFVTKGGPVINLDTVEGPDTDDEDVQIHFHQSGKQRTN
jgi:hypothetical protein